MTALALHWFPTVWVCETPLPCEQVPEWQIALIAMCVIVTVVHTLRG